MRYPAALLAALVFGLVNVGETWAGTKEAAEDAVFKLEKAQGLWDFHMNLTGAACSRATPNP